VTPRTGRSARSAAAERGWLHLEGARSRVEYTVGADVAQLRMFAYLLGLEPAVAASTCSRLAAAAAGLDGPGAVTYLVGCGLPLPVAYAAVAASLNGPAEAGPRNGDGRRRGNPPPVLSPAAVSLGEGDAAAGGTK
jgi:hypothetical protein